MCTVLAMILAALAARSHTHIHDPLAIVSSAFNWGYSCTRLVIEMKMEKVFLCNGNFYADLVSFFKLSNERQTTNTVACHKNDISPNNQVFVVVAC